MCGRGCLPRSSPESRTVPPVRPPRHLSLEVRGKRFGWCLEDHHGDGRLALNCRVPSGTNELFATSAPEKFHIPKYLGHRGWVGIWLDLRKIDWSQVEAVLVESYPVTARKSLVVQLRRYK
jgi:hypothetical protein